MGEEGDLQAKQAEQMKLYTAKQKLVQKDAQKASVLAQAFGAGRRSTRKTQR